MPKKPNIKFIIEEFWNRGYILYDNKFINAKYKMKYNCMNHPESELEITWSDFKSGRGCRQCANERIRKDKQKSIEEVRELFDSKGLVLVSDIYTNNRTELEFYCKEHSDEVQTTTEYCVKKSEVSVCKYCIGEFHSERMKGENCPFWRGGVRADNKALRETLDYKRWREKVFKRDDYTCQKCNCRGGDLQAHHILPFSDYEELRCEISNGITLCKKCHHVAYKGSFHNIYGTHNNTKEQLEEYLNKKVC